MTESDSVRVAVPESAVGGFALTLAILERQMGVDKIPNLHHYVDQLIDACTRHEIESNTLKGRGSIPINRRRFIAIFKTRYLQMTDLEYVAAITAADCKVINQVVQQLEDDGLTVDQYLEWSFDTYYPDNPRMCPPTLRHTCSSHIIEKFRYEFRSAIKRHKSDTAEKDLIMQTIAKSREIMRRMKELGIAEEREELRNVLKEYKDGNIMKVEFIGKIREFEKFLEGRNESHAECN
jgi:hypothetical protein